MDMGAFPEDKKIPLDVIINMWVEMYDLEDATAFAVLVDLSNRNLLTLVKDPRYMQLFMISSLCSHLTNLAWILLQVWCYVH